MTLEKLLYRIGEMGIRNKVINYSAAGSSIYEINANTIKSYPILFSSPTGNHKITDNMSEYEITLYYIDRLLNDSGNDIQIFSTAIEQLKYIIRNIDNMSDVLEVSEEYEIVNFTETEALNDRTAGAYTTIRINTKNQSDCYDEDIFTGPIRLQEKSIDITENGKYQVVYDKIYDGISEVDINVNVNVGAYYESGYEQGRADIVASARELTVTENGVYYTKYSEGAEESEGELFKTVNVDVAPKISISEYGVKFSQSSFSEVPEWAVFEDITDVENMFNGCSNLQTVPAFDISLVTNMSNMFIGCSNLQTIPEFDTSNVTNMYNTFNNCSSLVSLPALDARSLNMPSFYGIFGYSDLPNLTDFGGFLNLKCSLISDYSLKRLPNLSRESCINILNGLYDFVGAGEVPNSGQGQLKVHPNFISLVGDDINIAINKGWQITA